MSKSTTLPDYRKKNKRSVLAFLKVLSIFLCLFSASGAFAQKVTIEFDRAADFTKYKTFAVREGHLNSKNPAFNSELVKKRIESDIVSTLTAQGLMEVSGRADLNVFYQFGAVRKVEAERYPAGWYGLRTRVVRVPYSEGTLVMDLRDPETHSLVWRGIATEEKSDVIKIEGKLDSMVRKALGKYPPKEK